MVSVDRAAAQESPEISDIETRNDINLLLQAFYTRVFADAVLRHVFVDVAQMNLDEHLPVIGDFWEKVLFNTGPYAGHAMRVHQLLHEREPLTSAHFDRWLALWNQTIDDRHDGRNASQARTQAARIAVAIQRNLVRASATISQQPELASAQSHLHASRG